jgi:hypothetical protein
MTRLSRLHTLDPPSALVIPWGDQPATQNPGQERNHSTPGIVQVPQADPPMTGLHNTNQEQSGNNGTGIKQKHDFMNKIAHRARQKVPIK